MRCVRSFIAIAIGCGIALGGCGHSDDSAATPPAPTPKVVSGMSAAERAEYCFLFVPQEADAQARQAFIDELQGTWDYFPNSTGDKKTFDFDTKRDVATLTEYDFLGKNIADIAWKKLCVSQPLGADQGAFAGFRLVEMLANDNSGAAAIAVKMAPGPVLSLSDYYYARWTDADNELTDLSTALSAMSTIWVYSTKEP